MQQDATQQVWKAELEVLYGSPQMADLPVCDGEGLAANRVFSTHAREQPTEPSVFYHAFYHAWTDIIFSMHRQ